MKYEKQRVMSIRKIAFVEGEYYHVFNRGVDKRTIFENKDDLYYFFRRMIDLNTVDVDSKLKSKRFYQSGNVSKKPDDQLVSIVAYCLLPNHFHLVLKQECEKGISKFMQRLGTSYTVYFNNKHKRTGSLFQGKFKANTIDGEFGLPVLSVYVNLNYAHHNINPKVNFVKSSIFEYLGTELGDLACNQHEISAVIDQIGTIKDYQKFAKNTSKVFGENKGLIIKEIDLDKVFE